jgi:hypothetical protein
LYFFKSLHQNSNLFSCSSFTKYLKVHLGFTNHTFYLMHFIHLSFLRFLASFNF